MKFAKLFPVVAAAVFFFAGESARAQLSTQPDVCFAVADGYIDGSGTHEDGNSLDTLVLLNKSNGNTNSVNGVVPNMPTFNVEAAAFPPNSTTLYASDANRLGTVNLTNGNFTALAFTYGTAKGYFGNNFLTNVVLDDVDGISFDVNDPSILWGVHRSEDGPDLLFRIDPQTGRRVADAFVNTIDPSDSPFVDFVEIEAIDGQQDIDDLAVSPTNGQLYAIMNDGGFNGKLVIIDTTNGATTEIGDFRRASNQQVVDDMEGLSFARDGKLYGSTGKSFANSNILWEVDPATALLTDVGSFTNNLRDIEGLACLNADGGITVKKYTNGDDADVITGPLVPVGGAVNWTYIVSNTGSVTLFNVTVQDDLEGLICTIQSLAPGQTNLSVGVTCAKSGVAQAGQYENIATATGTDQFGTVFTATDPSHYFGVILASLGDFVWNDANSNGVQDLGEAGVAGVTVRLLDQSFAVLATTVTNAAGLYGFTGLAAGTYAVEFVLPANSAFTMQGNGSQAAIDSDADGSTGRTSLIALGAGQTNLTIDAGIVVLQCPVGQVKDQCGVCGGTGSTCSPCDTEDVMSELFAMDGGSAQQAKIVKSAVKKARKLNGDPSYGADIIVQADQLHIANWALTWSVPTAITSCPGNSLCVEVSHAASINGYVTNAATLRDLALKMHKVIKRLSAKKNVKYDGSVKRSAEKAYDKNVAVAKTVPTSTSSCAVS